jgi:hypothetical protein
VSEKILIGLAVWMGPNHTREIKDTSFVLPVHPHESRTIHAPDAISFGQHDTHALVVRREGF